LGAVKWFTVHVGGQKWRVDLVRGKHPVFDGDERTYGITQPEKGRIYIAKEQGEQALEDTVLHELLHAVFTVSNAGNIIANAVETKTADPDRDIEEDVVHAMVPTLHRLLKDLGFKFPKPPGVQ
jgi:hypothetical protein